MSLSVIAEVWDVISGHIDLGERGDAADTLVNYLIDNNYETDEIKDEFRGDKHIIKALAFYMDRNDMEEEYQDYDEDEDEDKDW